MEEKCFDEKFIELLEMGSRHDFASYRNCIIEELRMRTTKEDVEAVKDAFATVLGVQAKKRIMYALATIILTIMLCINISMGILSLKIHNLGFLVLNVGIGLLNAFNVLTYSFKFVVACCMLGEYTSTVIVIPYKKSENAEQFPEIFGVISEDSEEMLNRKKAKLDEILGF